MTVDLDQKVTEELQEHKVKMADPVQLDLEEIRVQEETLEAMVNQEKMAGQDQEVSSHPARHEISL